MAWVINIKRRGIRKKIQNNKAAAAKHNKCGVCLECVE